MKTKTITFDDLDAALILPGLKEGLTKVKQDISILLLTKKRDLTKNAKNYPPTSNTCLKQNYENKLTVGYLSECIMNL